MIRESSRYYGAVLSYIVDQCQVPVKIRRECFDYSGFYVVNENIPIYVKYATRRHGPWTFNFQKDHYARYEKLFQEYGECAMVFVCGGDGIVALYYDELLQVLGEELAEQRTVGIRRKLKHMYRIKGRGGELDRKIARNSLAMIVQSTLS